MSMAKALFDEATWSGIWGPAYAAMSVDESLLDAFVGEETGEMVCFVVSVDESLLDAFVGEETIVRVYSAYGDVTIKTKAQTTTSAIMVAIAILLVNVSLPHILCAQCYKNSPL